MKPIGTEMGKSMNRSFCGSWRKLVCTEMLGPHRDFICCLLLAEFNLNRFLLERDEQQPKSHKHCELFTVLFLFVNPSNICRLPAHLSVLHTAGNVRPGGLNYSLKKAVLFLYRVHVRMGFWIYIPRNNLSLLKYCCKEAETLYYLSFLVKEKTIPESKWSCIWSIALCSCHLWKWPDSGYKYSDVVPALSKHWYKDIVHLVSFVPFPHQ